MADVQLEHGHVRVANRLFEAMLDADFTGAQLKMVLGLIRLTYGWRRKTVSISVPDLAAKLRLAPVGGFRRALRELVDEGVVIEVERGTGHTAATYAIEKDFTCWGKFSTAPARLARMWGEKPLHLDAAFNPSEARTEPDDEATSESVTPQGYHPLGSPGLTPQGQSALPHRDIPTAPNDAAHRDLPAPKDSDRQLQTERHPVPVPEGAIVPRVAAPVPYVVDDPTPPYDRPQAPRIVLPPNAERLVSELYGAPVVTEQRRTDVRRQLYDAIDPTKRGARIRTGVYVKTTAERLDRVCLTVLKDPPQKYDAAIVCVLQKISAPETDEHGRTVTEAASANTKAMIALEERYEAAARLAANAWVTDHREQYDAILARLSAQFGDITTAAENDWRRVGFDAARLSEVRKASGFPDFETWRANDGRVAGSGRPLARAG